MSNYIKGTDFAGKDSLETGNPAKIVKGAEIDDEFNAIAVAINSKANTNSPALTGVPTAPTAALGTNNTQLATTAFTKAAIDAIPAAEIIAGTAINVSGNTVSHADTSSQASVNNSGNTFIQDITLDTFGHITAITSGTVADYTAPDPTTTQVLTATAGASVGAVGTYAFLSGADSTPGVTYAGASLYYAGVYIPDNGSGTTIGYNSSPSAGYPMPTGTWRAMGWGKAAAGLSLTISATLYLRIS